MLPGQDGYSGFEPWGSVQLAIKRNSLMSAMAFLYSRVFLGAYMRAQLPYTKIHFLVQLETGRGKLRVCCYLCLQFMRCVAIWPR